MRRMVQSVVNYSVLTLAILAGWYLYDSINFMQAQAELEELVERTQHIGGQRVAEKVLGLAKKHMLLPVRGIDAASKFGELEYRVGMIYDPLKPSHCWQPTHEVLQDLKVSYAFSLGHEKIVGGIDSVQAFKVAKEDHDFQRALLLEEKLAKLFNLDFIPSHATSWNQLKRIRDGIESAADELSRELGINIFAEARSCPLPDIRIQIPSPSQSPQPQQQGHVKKNRWC